MSHEVSDPVSEPTPEPEPLVAAPPVAVVRSSSAVGHCRTEPLTHRLVHQQGIATFVGDIRPEHAQLDETLCERHRARVAAHYAFLMAGHPRLGAASPASCLTADLLEYVVRLKQATDTGNAYLLLTGGMVRRAMRLWSSTTVRALHIPTGRWHAEAALPK